MSLKEDEVPKVQKALGDRISVNKSDSVIIEGYEYGQPLNCHGVLRNVLTPTANLKSESSYLIKKAFFGKMAIIPGDNQFPDSNDRSTFFKDDASFEKARQEFIFVDILHQYYTNLLNGAVEPLKEAIKTSCLNRHYSPEVSVEDFKKQYKTLNSRELPTDSQTIYEDFTPAVFSKKPRGTNQLVDHQFWLRNQSLLTAIQIANSTYQHPAIIFGSGHLTILGPELETHVKTVKNVNFKSKCDKK